DIDGLLELNVLWDIHDHGPWPPGGRNVERLVNDARKILHVAHQPIVLGARPRDADGIAFLERVIADEVGCDLPGDHDKRNRIHQRIGQAGHRICGAWSGRYEDDARLSRRARIPFGRVYSPLLVTDENMNELIVFEE